MFLFLTSFNYSHYVLIPDLRNEDVSLRSLLFSASPPDYCHCSLIFTLLTNIFWNLNKYINLKNIFWNKKVLELKCFVLLWKL
jgi:hypothetical protein